MLEITFSVVNITTECYFRNNIFCWIFFFQKFIGISRRNNTISIKQKCLKLLLFLDPLQSTDTFWYKIIKLLLRIGERIRKKKSKRKPRMVIISRRCMTLCLLECVTKMNKINIFSFDLNFCVEILAKFFELYFCIEYK